jgi:predicted O-methyltransferase YrrM
MNEPISEVIRTALQKYGGETSLLLPLAERRYDQSLFPSTGQYDWFSAQVLYCLIRHIRPRTIIEVSTSSGYSTAIQAMALRQNGSGHIHSFEINPTYVAAATCVLKHFEIEEPVTIHTGDARTSAGMAGALQGPVLLFLDSLHTKEFAEWFIKQWVQKAPAGTLFHVHDVMPPTARVRFGGGPPWRNEWMDGLRDYARGLLGRPTRKQLGHISPGIYPAGPGEEWHTTDGVWTTEAELINTVVSQMPADSYAYLHDWPERFLPLEPRRFDGLAIKRQNCRGVPMEWNETVWIDADEFKKVYSGRGRMSGDTREETGL